MVALVVVIAAIVANAGLGKTAGLGQDTPQVQLEWSYDPGASYLYVTHDGGDDLSTYEGSVYLGDGGGLEYASDITSGGNALTSAGSTAELGTSWKKGDTAQVYYVPPNGEEATVLGSYTIPENSKFYNDGPSGDTDGDGVENQNDADPLNPNIQ
jgi:FlaG/FlaF family flagellin (archaellin)